MNEPMLPEERLVRLRELVAPDLPDRMPHTLGVEREAARLGAIYLPGRVPALRCAALLHDLTKRLPVAEQLQICREYGILTKENWIAAPQVLHAVTAAAVAPVRFPSYCDPEIVGGIRWHTTGRAGMTLFEAIIYLADYIEETRTFEDCRALRTFFWEQYRETAAPTEKTVLLRRTLVQSFDRTIAGLLRRGAPIENDTVEARNWLLQRTANAENEW